MEIAPSLIVDDVTPASPQGDGDAVPDVLADIVDDVEGDDDQQDDNYEGMEEVEAHSVVEVPAFIPPQLPFISNENAVQGFHVRLTLSVGAAGATIAPGLEIDDCGMCPFCLDKPKYGGPGTKRQKCELKQQEASFNVESSTPRIWGKLHLITAQEREHMLEIQKLPLPEPLVKAMEIGPLPLVWAYRRKRRARTLPPAYVLMYYCEERVPLDRTQLAVSRQRYFKNSRPDLANDGKPKARKARPRLRPNTITPAMQPAIAPAHASVHAGWERNAPHYAYDDGSGMVGHPDGGYAPQYGQSGVVVYAQPAGAPMYPGAPPGYMVGGPPGPPGSMYPPPPMYAQPPMYAAPPPPPMYAPPPPPMAPVAPRRGRKGRAVDQSGAGPPVHAEYYPPPVDAYGYPTMGGGLPPPTHMDHAQVPVAHEVVDDEPNSWIADPSGDEPAENPRAKKTKRGGASRTVAAAAAPSPAAASAPAPAAGDDDANAMSNKTLDLMLSRLQGQLPPATYEKVITLVRDVQCRRMSLSRSEFLQHFQAICAGKEQPR